MKISQAYKNKNMKAKSSFGKLSSLLVVISVSLLGVFLIIDSHAATPVASVEAESGTVGQSAQVVNDVNASNAAAIRFGTVPTAAPNCISVVNLCGYTSVFDDEFSGTALNTAVWKPYYNTYGDANKELECNTPNNVSVLNGTLRIVAKRETVVCNGGSTRNFTTAFLGTRETGTYFPKYGYYEMRAKLPHGQGLWPAFWLRHINGASTAEVDIMEYFHSQVPGKTTSTLHLDNVANVSKKTIVFEQPTLTPAWHTWAVNIVPSGTNVIFTFYLDGVAFHTYTDTAHVWANNTTTNSFDIALNMAVGGKYVGRPDDALGFLFDLNICAQSGTPPSGCTSTGILRAAFPSTYEIDYVHVYQKN